MKKIQIIILISLLLSMIILSGCEFKTSDGNKLKICNDFCLSKNMTRTQYTGTGNNYINCGCQKILYNCDEGLSYE